MSAFDVTEGYRRYGEAVLRRARRILRDDAAARDALQETFLRAHRFQSSFRGDASPLTWLFTITDRVCFDALGKRKPTEPLPDEGSAGALGALGSLDMLEAPLPSAEARVLRDELLARVLGHADDETKRILVGRYVDELDTKQIAERIGASERTVRRRLEEFFGKTRAQEART